VAIALVANWPYNNRSRYFVATDYLDNIYSAIEPGGMLLTRDWQVYSPSLYQREIEHRRQDVVAIDVNQLRRSWYFDYLARAYPTTIEQARDKVDAFLEDLTHWERDPDLYQRDAMLNQRISARFYEMILAFVSNHIQTAPVYVTLDIAANRDGTDSELTKALTKSYQLFPQGLIFQATGQRGFVEPSGRPLVTRGLIDGTNKFDDGDVVKVKVLPVYVMMFYNLGRYFAANGKHQQAIDAFKQAIELQPGFSPARQGISDSVKAIGKPNPF
jgi:tetratricopeptide (TPR) repeat protein